MPNWCDTRIVITGGVPLRVRYDHDVLTDGGFPFLSAFYRTL